MTLIPVLTFHSVAELRSPLAFGAAPFARLMARLAAAGWRTVSAADAVACARRVRDVPPRSFVITFDDGYASVLRAAAPVLRQHEFSAVLFVATELVGKKPIFPGERLCPQEPALTWTELRDLVESGFEIGSHACDHVKLTALPDADLDRQLVESKKILEQKLGVAVGLHAYPFGACDRRVAAAAGRVYDGAFTTRLDWVRAGDDPSQLPRLDSHYLRHLAARGALDGAGTRAWIALRRAGRALRGTGAGS